MKRTYTQKMVELWKLHRPDLTTHNPATPYGQQMTDFYMRDIRMKFLEEKQIIAVCDHLFEYVSEMIYYLYDAGFSFREIADKLNITPAAVRYQLKEMAVKPRARGGCNVPGESPVTGVVYRSERNKYAAHMHKKGTKGNKHYFGHHNTLLEAVIARRFGELKHGYTEDSAAQAYIIKHRNCDAHECSLCWEYRLDILPLICVGGEPRPVGSIPETWTGFLDRARAAVLKQFAFNK